MFFSSSKYAWQSRCNSPKMYDEKLICPTLNSSKSSNINRLQHSGKNIFSSMIELAMSFLVRWQVKDTARMQFTMSISRMFIFSLAEACTGRICSPFTPIASNFCKSKHWLVTPTWKQAFAMCTKSSPMLSSVSAYSLKMTSIFSRFRSFQYRSTSLTTTSLYFLLSPFLQMLAMTSRYLVPFSVSPRRVYSSHSCFKAVVQFSLRSRTSRQAFSALSSLSCFSQQRPIMRWTWKTLSYLQPMTSSSSKASSKFLSMIIFLTAPIFFLHTSSIVNNIYNQIPIYSGMDSMETLKQYGKLGIITHLALSWTFLLGTYIFIQRTGKSGVLIKKLKLEDKIPEKAGSFVVAGIIYKAVMPFRLALSLVTLPVVVKVFGIEPDVAEEVKPAEEEVQMIETPKPSEL